MTRCVCGCRRKAVQGHHVFRRQELRRHGGSVGDGRNIVPVALKCHGDHHARSRPLSLSVLPDSVFEFGAELMGEGRAYEFLRRFYGGRDSRLDALLEASIA